MELEHVADFGPEVAREPLEERPPRKLMVTQLEDHKAHAGEHAQGQVLCRGRAAAAPLGAQGLAHSSGHVHAQRQLKATGVQQGLRAGADTWASENLRGSSTGQLNWQDCLGMEEDIAWLGRGCSSFSGLQAFSRGLAVLGAALQGCSPSRGQAGQGRESP